MEGEKLEKLQAGHGVTELKGYKENGENGAVCGYNSINSFCFLGDFEGGSHLQNRIGFFHENPN